MFGESHDKKIKGIEVSDVTINLIQLLEEMGLRKVGFTLKRNESNEIK